MHGCFIHCVCVACILHVCHRCITLYAPRVPLCAAGMAVWHRRSHERLRPKAGHAGCLWHTAWPVAFSIGHGLWLGLLLQAWSCTTAVRPASRPGLHHGLRRTARHMVCIMACGLPQGLWPASWHMVCIMAYGLQHGILPAAGFMACSQDSCAQHGSMPTLWTLAYIKVYGLHYGGLWRAAWPMAHDALWREA